MYICRLKKRGELKQDWEEDLKMVGEEGAAS
jgi:hypothetical protein